MKKLSIVAVISILLICVVSIPTWTKAESCPSTDTYISKYFTLNDKLPYKEENNKVTFTIKKEYLNYVKAYVNDIATEDASEQHTGLTTPDGNGNITLDLIADQNAGYADTTITFYFTTAPDLSSAKDCATIKKTYTFTPDEGSADLDVDEETKEMERELGLLPSTDASLDDLKDDTFIKVSDITKTNSLSCDYGKTDGKTVKKYTYTSTKNVTNNCVTTCREDIIVTLDPPVITQSGMCFSYVVDIKSKVACSSKYTGEKPKRYQGCIASSYCSGGTDKGGPNEEFDSCVASCDNGQYTQSCINKCYTNVYEKNTKTTKVSTSNESETKQYLNRLKASNTFIKPMDDSLRTVNVGVANVTCYTDDYLASTGWMNDEQLTNLATEVYNSKQFLPGGYYGLTDGYEWYPSYRYYSYDISNGTYKLNKTGGCLSKISPHYFSSVAKTKLTIRELNGTYYYPGTSRIHRYISTGSLIDASINKYKYAGALVRHQLSYDGGNSFITSNCGEFCSVSPKCSNLIRKGDNKYPGTKWAIVTGTQANMIYKAELKAYVNEKKKCVQSSKSCYNTATSSYTIKVDETSKNTGKNLENTYDSNQKIDQGKAGSNKSSKSGTNPSMIINTNGLCITGECANKNQEYCSNLDKNSSDYQAYCEDKNSCKLSGIPACKNGDKCFDYHTTLSFPKNYINVKTGQTKVEIKNAELPFYVAIGNAYCTNLSTKEVNVNWYDYKIDDTNTVAKPSKINKYNITGTIKNYGLSKWNFDFKCFYAIKNPDTGDCVGDNCVSKNCVGDDCNPCVGEKCDNGNDGGNVISKVKVRSVNLSDLFPNRTPRFNWSSEAKNLNNSNYKVNPTTLIKAIEDTGDAVYDENKEDKYLDYHIVLTKDTINKIRNYNKGKTYNNSDDGTGLNRINGEGTWGVTVYRSKLLDNLGTSVITKRGLIGCNNQTSSTTCNQEGGN